MSLTDGVAVSLVNGSGGGVILDRVVLTRGVPSVDPNQGPCDGFPTPNAAPVVAPGQAFAFDLGDVVDGVAVGTVQAIDDRSDIAFFAITSGNPAGEFGIDRDGTLRILDHHVAAGGYPSGSRRRTRTALRGRRRSTSRSPTSLRTCRRWWSPRPTTSRRPRWRRAR